MYSILNKIQLPNLNLPAIEVNLQEKEGKICVFDQLRKRHLVLTPEEWVRQHWIHFLNNHLNFPKGLISLEKTVTYNNMQKRTDLVVFDLLGAPYLLIECKAPKVKLSKATIEQACMYHKQLQTPFLIISNGLQHICLSYDLVKGQFLQEKDFPKPPN